MTIKRFFEITDGQNDYFNCLLETETNGKIGYLKDGFSPNEIQVLPEREKFGCRKFETIAELRKMLVNEKPDKRLSIDHVRLVKRDCVGDSFWELYNRDYRND